MLSTPPKFKSIIESEITGPPYFMLCHHSSGQVSTWMACRVRLASKVARSVRKYDTTSEITNAKSLYEVAKKCMKLSRTSEDCNYEGCYTHQDQVALILLRLIRKTDKDKNPSEVHQTTHQKPRNLLFQTRQNLRPV